MAGTKKMGWFRRLFAKKNGGTEVGLALRNVGNFYVSKLTGGILNNAVTWVFPIPDQADVDAQFNGAFNDSVSTNDAMTGIMAGSGTGCGKLITSAGSSMLNHVGSGTGDLNDLWSGCRQATAQTGTFKNINLVPSFVGTLGSPSGYGTATPTNTVFDFLTPITSSIPTGFNGATTNDNDQNILGLPDEIVTIINTTLDTFDIGNGQIDINNIPETTIQILDEILGEEMPTGLAEILGVNPVTLETLPTNNWNVNGTVGGVNVNIGSESEEPITPIEETTSITNYVVGGLVAVLVVVGGWFGYKKYNN